MDPSLILSSGKALLDFAKALLALIGGEKLDRRGAQRLFSLYVSLSEYVEAKEEFFNFVEGCLNEASLGPDEKKDALWRAKKLGNILAKKHYQAYSLTDGLDLIVKPFNRPLYEFLKTYQGRISLSMGFSQEQVMLHRAFHAISASHRFKYRDFEDLYRLSLRKSRLFMGDLALEEDPRYRAFLSLHRESRDFYAKFIAELECVVRNQIEMNELL